MEHGQYKCLHPIFFADWTSLAIGSKGRVFELHAVTLRTMSTSPQFAFVTLVTSDSYLPGALVVAAALQDVHSSPPVHPDEYDPSEYDRVCLVTPETLDVNTIKQLRRAFDVVVGVEVIEEDTEEGLKLLGG